MPDTCERMSIRFAFWLAHGSESSQSLDRISDGFVFQLSEDKPVTVGSGVMLRPWAKSSINIPSEALRNAFEQEPMLNSV